VSTKSVPQTCSPSPSPSLPGTNTYIGHSHPTVLLTPTGNALHKLFGIGIRILVVCKYSLYLLHSFPPLPPPPPFPFPAPSPPPPSACSELGDGDETLHSYRFFAPGRSCSGSPETKSRSRVRKIGPRIVAYRAAREEEGRCDWLG